jgi:hypothetical protein
MHLRAKLQAHFSTATWTDDAATWSENGEKRVLYWVDGPLAAGQVIDAHVRALAHHAKPTLAYVGSMSEVARAAAARFGVTLFNAAVLPEPASGVPTPSPADAPQVRPHLRPIETPPALVAQMVEPLLPAHVEPEPAPPPAAPSPAAPEPDVDPRFPWPVAPPVEPPLRLRVSADELAAMPWNAPHVLLQAAPLPDEEHHELLVSERRPAGGFRPSQMPNWGLPWPRPVPPTDGLAIADPKLWGARERVHAVREDLDRIGSGSFGAVKPEGSGWLKKLRSDGP